MSQRPRLAVFDLDGTLIDSAAAIVDGVAACWEACGFPPPDPEQVKQTGVDVDTLEKQEQKARDLFQFVKEEHPGTPWARRAKRELNQGFGMHFVEDFRNPNYNKRDIDIPEF